MKKKFDEDELHTAEDDHINSLIMSQASDIAEQLTELECKLAGIECWITEKDGLSDNDVMKFTDEAQDIFDVYYDDYKTELYGLLNAQLKIIK